MWRGRWGRGTSRCRFGKSADGKSVFYTAKEGRNVELFRVPLDGRPEQLTETAAGSMHYHPNPSPDGR
jgi:hypothetical protein